MSHADKIIMRTTIRMNEELSRQVKSLADREGTSFTSLMEEAAQMLLAHRRKSRKNRKIKLPTYRGRGLQPGVDLTDSRALLERMESDLPLERRR
jgi:hypothetical protein